MAKAYVEAKLHVMGINDGVIILAMHFSFLYLGVEGQAKGRHCNHRWARSSTPGGVNAPMGVILLNKSRNFFRGGHKTVSPGGGTPLTPPPVPTYELPIYGRENVFSKSLTFFQLHTCSSMERRSVSNPQWYLFLLGANISCAMPELSFD